MRIRIGVPLSLAWAAGALMYATPARAESVPDTSGCTGTLATTLQPGEPDPELGMDLSRGKPIAQNQVAYRCGHLTVDASATTMLAGGEYGKRGPGDELDAGFTYKNSLRLPLVGNFDYEGSVHYRALDLGRHISSSGDDYLRFAVEVSRPTQIKQWTAAPFVRFVEDSPIGHNNRLYFFDAGARAYGPFIGDTSLYLETLFATDVNSTYATPHRHVLSGVVMLDKPWGPWWTITFGLKVTQYAIGDGSVTRSFKRDGKIVQKYKLDGKHTVPWEVTPLIALTYQFR
jgi:hypothetical protein